MTEQTFDAFTDENDPRFVRFVLPLARLSHSRELRASIIKLVLGLVLSGVILPQFWSAHWLLLAFMLFLPVFALFATGQQARYGNHLRRGDYPSKLIAKERALIQHAINANPPKAGHITPHIDELRRKVYIVRLLRLLVLVALLACIAVNAALG